MNIWTRAATFDARRGAGRAWMYGIVRHRALDAVRSGARTVSADEDDLDALQADEPPAAPDMAEAFALRADLGRLEDCLGRLDTPKRNCVLLRLPRRLHPCRDRRAPGCAAGFGEGLDPPGADLVAGVPRMTARGSDDELAAAYVLGTLSAERRRAVQARLAERRLRCVSRSTPGKPACCR
jgi:hypothetical protein